MSKKKIDMSDPEWQIKKNFGDDETAKNNTFSGKSQFERDFEKQLRKMEKIELHKVSQESYLKRVFEVIYMKYSKEILKLGNEIIDNKDETTEFKTGFQNALMCSLQALLNVKNEMVNK